MKNTCFIIFVFFLNGVICGPKVYQNPDGAFEPSNRYYESNLPDYRSKHQNFSKPERKESKESRFGIIPISTTSYGSNGNGVQYGSGNVGYTISPMKIDIGGVALGAILGLGLVLIIPKIANIVGGGGGYGGYRSLETEMSSVTDVLARIDNSLEQHNIDSSSCIQRTICSYVNSAQKNIKNGEATGVDEFITSLSNNTLLSYMLDGTAVKEAAETGKANDEEQCNNKYPKCPLTKDNVLKVLGSLLPA
ncbi:uncharacterized protein LOC126887450 [Diabrotica virgifera virgifera]|uniref:Uncharacterized protein LOC114330973 n=1 Tax=Diabrotica virgifera virgifera TaxID=50390 RepID=A0A6P7FTE1_DIAVI|nr:uncharacterized protein LOC126887450 [Diabrotica virgifera virgifera]